MEVANKKITDLEDLQQRIKDKEKLLQEIELADKNFA